MEEILKVAEEHNLYVIEDNAQAIGADYTFSDGVKKEIRNNGDFRDYIFLPSKTLDVTVMVELFLPMMMNWNTKSAVL